MECSNPCCSTTGHIISAAKLVIKFLLLCIVYQALLSYEKSNDKYIEWANVCINKMKVDPNALIPPASPNTPATTPLSAHGEVKSPYDVVNPSSK